MWEAIAIAAELNERKLNFDRAVWFSRISCKIRRLGRVVVVSLKGYTS